MPWVITKGHPFSGSPKYLPNNTRYMHARDGNDMFHIFLVIVRWLTSPTPSPPHARGHRSRQPTPPPVRLRSCSLSSPHSLLIRFRPARCPSVGLLMLVCAIGVTQPVSLSLTAHFPKLAHDQHASWSLTACSHDLLP